MAKLLLKFVLALILPFTIVFSPVVFGSDIDHKEPAVDVRWRDLLVAISDECERNENANKEIVDALIESIYKSMKKMGQEAADEEGTGISLDKAELEKIEKIYKHCLIKSGQAGQKKIYDLLDVYVEFHEFGMKNFIHFLSTELTNNVSSLAGIEKYISFANTYPFSGSYIEFTILLSKIKLKYCLDDSTNGESASMCLLMAKNVFKEQLTKIAELNSKYSKGSKIPYYYRFIDDLYFTMIFYDLVNLEPEKLQAYISGENGVHVKTTTTVNSILKKLGLTAEIADKQKNYIDQIYIGDFINFCDRPYRGYVGRFIPMDRAVSVLLEYQIEKIEDDLYSHWLSKPNFQSLCGAYIDAGEKFTRNDIQLAFRLNSSEEDIANDIVDKIRVYLQENGIATADVNGRTQDVSVAKQLVERYDGEFYSVKIAEPVVGRGITDQEYSSLVIFLDSLGQEISFLHVIRPKVVW